MKSKQNKTYVQSKFFILGAARSGISAARLLKKQGIEVFVSELKFIPQNIQDILNNENIPFEQNGHDNQNLCENFDVLVISPGIPLTAEAIVKAKSNRLRIISEIELALEFLNPNTKLIGITGTNGKSTTTHYLAHLLNAHGMKAAACGNIGTPLTEVIRESNDYDALAVELSSYQLELGISKSFDASILLNLQNDHLARHKTFENYLNAKWNSILATKEDGICIIDDTVLKMAKDFNFPMPTCKIISLSNSKQELTNQVQSQLLIDIKNPCLLGAHNATNIFAASLAAMHVGVSKETIMQQWEKETSTYKPLPHRLEVVKTSMSSHNAVRIFINDSKATNVESTLVALKSLPKNVHLLMGGEPKGDSYLPIAEFLGRNVIRAYPFGKAAQQIYNELKDFHSFLETPSHDMISAGEKALAQSHTGDIILLSPACSSFDEFNNFEHRGDVFKAWVRASS